MEERQKAKAREESTQFGNSGGPSLELPHEKGKTHEILAKKAGIGKSSMAYLLAVYRNRPDLFELVFDGGYSASSSLINVSNSFISSTSNALAIASSARLG